MTISNRPAKLTEWASSGAGTTEPSEGKKDLGWIKEAPAYQYFNWIFKNSWDFQKYVDSLLGPLMSKGPFTGNYVTYDSTAEEFTVTAGTMLIFDGERVTTTSADTVSAGTPNAGTDTRIDYVVCTQGSPGEGVQYELIEGTTPSADQYVLATVWVDANALSYDVLQVLNTCRFNEQGHRVTLRNSNSSNGNSLLFGNDSLQDAIDLCSAMGGGVVEISGDSEFYTGEVFKNIRLKSGVVIDGLTQRQIRTADGQAHDTGTESFTAASDLVNDTAHGLADGDGVQFTVGTLPPELTLNREYYVRDATTDSYKVSATPFGAAINLSTSPTGVTRFSFKDAAFIARGIKLTGIVTIQNGDEFSCADVDFSNYGIGSAVYYSGAFYRIVEIVSATVCRVVTWSGGDPSLSDSSTATIIVYLSRCGFQNLYVNADGSDPIPFCRFGYTIDLSFSNIQMTAYVDPMVLGIYSANEPNSGTVMSNVRDNGNVTIGLSIQADSTQSVSDSNFFNSDYIIQNCHFTGSLVIGVSGSETTSLWTGRYFNNIVEGTESIPDLCGIRDSRWLEEHNLVGTHGDITSTAIDNTGTFTTNGLARFGAGIQVDAGDIDLVTGDFQVSNVAKKIKTATLENIAGTKQTIGTADAFDLELKSGGTVRLIIDNSTGNADFQTFDIQTTGTAKVNVSDTPTLKNTTGVATNIFGSTQTACTFEGTTNSGKISFLVVDAIGNAPLYSTTQTGSLLLSIADGLYWNNGSAWTSV